MTKPLQPPTEPNAPAPYAAAIIRLFKGVAYNDEPDLWTLFICNRLYIEQYFRQIGIQLYYNETDAYAYITQNSDEDDGLPRLITRRPLKHSVTLILVLLREEINNFDQAVMGEPNLTFDTVDLVAQLRAFYPDSSDERQRDKAISADIKTVVEMGFVKLLDGNQRMLVRPSIKSRINSDILDTLKTQLQEYTQREGIGNNEE